MAGKGGKGKVDLKQRKLPTKEITDEDVQEKRVSFKMDEKSVEKVKIDKEELERWKKEIVDTCRKEIKRSVEEMKAFIGYVEKKWESRYEEIGDKINVLMENKLELDKDGSEKSTRMESVGSVGDNGSERSYGGRWSSTGGRSMKSNEDRLSERSKQN